MLIYVSLLSFKKKKEKIEVKFPIIFKLVFIKFLFTEYAGNIGDAKDPETKAAEQNRILQLVDKF